MGEWPELRTDRLLLRGWTSDDRIALAAINADPRVMEFIGNPMTLEQNDAFADRIQAKFAQQGFGFWAVEVPGLSSFIGFVGLNIPDFEAPFMPAVEVGWRLSADFWGHGYASEAARAALDFGFEAAGLDEIVAFTTERNIRSRRVMERIGMTRDSGDDFEHPRLPGGSPLRPHVLYRVRAAACPTRSTEREDAVGSDMGAVAADDAEDIASGHPDFAGVYGWPEVAKVLALFFAPFVLVLAVGALWLLIDKDGLRQVVLGSGSEATDAAVLTSAITLPSTLLALWFIAVRNRRRGLTWAALGVCKAPLGRSLKYMVGFFALLLVTVVGFGAVMVVLQVPAPEAAVHPARSTAQWIWLLAGAVIVGPLGEEVIYRGMLFGFLRHRHRVVVAALISSAVFMLAHVSPVAFVTALPLGLYLCFMYHRLGSIVPGMAVHMAWNLLVSQIR